MRRIYISESQFRDIVRNEISPAEKKRQMDSDWEDIERQDAMMGDMGNDFEDYYNERTKDDYLNSRLVTPEMIGQLKPNEVFVFGSNLKGLHYGGAALFAVKRFGAEMGNGIGLQGQSWAIPTLYGPGANIEGNKLPLDEIRGYVDDMLSYAERNPSMVFYVTPLGCGIAGFTESEIAPLFKDAVYMKNVALPESFYEILEG